MTQSKPWYASVGVWGAIVSALGSMLSILKVEVDPTFLADLREWLISAATLIGAGVALYGRLRASRRIASVAAPTGAPRLILLLMTLSLLLMTGCSVLTSPAEAARAADRATYDAVAPEYSQYVSRDAALTPEQRERRERTVEAWKMRVNAAD